MAIVPAGEGPEHYRWGPSSSKRLLACPGSIAAADLPDDTNPAAEAGTVGHHSAENSLNDKGLYLPALLDHEVYIGASEHVDDVKSAEVAQATVDYVEYVNSLDGIKHHEVKVEHDYIPDFGGTIDTVVIHKNGITIVDLKTGTGKVPAKNNTQLQCYSILARQEFPAKNVTGVIVQSRVYKKPQVAKYDHPTLDALEGQIENTIDSPVRIAGDHCYFCPLKPTCEEYKRNG